jgi:hypothetical protein
MEWITDSFFKFILIMAVITPFALKGFGKMNRFAGGIFGKTAKHGAFHVIGRLFK